MTEASRQAAAKPNRRRAAARAPIELYYWPTPNGWKISIMLEECAAALRRASGRYFQGRTIRAAIFWRSRRTTAFRPSSIPTGPAARPISVFESGAILQYLGRKTGKFYPRDERARVAVDEWLFWQMGGLGPMAGQAVHFRRYAPRADPLRDRALHRRGQPALRRHEHAACHARISGRPLFHCRHRLRRLGAPCRAPGTGSRAVSASQALVRNHPRAPRGQARASPSASKRRRRSTSTIRRCAPCCSVSARGTGAPARASAINSPASRSATCR